MLFHDRAHDLATVETAARRALSGAGALVTITGTPGTGRSAFLDAAAGLAAERDFTVLRGRGSRLDHGLVFGVARQILASAARPEAAGPWDVTDESAPPAPSAQRLDAGGPRAALLDAVTASGRAGADGPVAVAVVVDDLQWADESSLAWLAGLLTDAGAAQPLRLLVVVAVCEGEAATELPGVQDVVMSADEVIRLRPLTVDGVRAMLRQRAVVLPEEESREWTRATGGIPALVTSLFDSADGPPRPLAVALARPAPWSLRGRVAAALNSHPEPVRTFAYCAALLGGAVEDALITRLARLDPTEGAAAARTLRGLGWTGDRCEPPVLWDCVREIAEDAYDIEGCNDLHRRAARLLYMSGYPVERGAAHLLRVGPGTCAPAAHVLREAADEARRRGDRRLAVRYLRRALCEFPTDSPRRGEFLAVLAHAEQEVDTSAMLRHVAQAATLLEPARERAAVVAAVPLTLAISAPPAAYRVIESARASLATLDTPAAQVADLAARLEARARLSRLDSPGASADAVARLRELDDEADRWTAARRELVAVLVFSGTAGGTLSADEVGTRVRRLLECEPTSVASGYAATSLLIASGTAAGAGEPVRSWLDMALETAVQRGDDRQRTRILCWRAMAAQQAGHLADAWSDARDVCEPASAALGENDWLSVLGLMSVVFEMGDPWLADRVQDFCAGLRDGGPPALRAGRLALRASTAPMTELPALVAELVNSVRAACAAGWHNPSLFPMAYWSTPALLRLGDTETALALIAHECERARTWGSPTALGRTLRVWGALLPGRYALSLLAEAVAALRESPNRLELARALTAYGTRLRDAERPGADELLAEAEEIADSLGTTLLRYWPESGRGESRGAGVLGTELSVTERRVAGLVALGRTNQDVAEELDITRRAVEKCLTGLYRRLGVSSRAELVPVVRRIAGGTAFRGGVLSEPPHRLP